MKRVEAPVRIDFAGGWADVPYLIHGRIGHVSNVAIKRLVSLSDNDLNMNGYPRGTGLATSTAVGALRLLQTEGNFIQEKDLGEIAERLLQKENDGLIAKIGRQDPYVVTYGGFNCWRFDQTSAQSLPLNITKDNLKLLQERLVLFYSGLSRDAQSVVQQVYHNYDSQDPAYREAIEKISQCGLEFSAALESGDLDHCGRIISENWEAQKRLASLTSNPEVDEIYDLAMSEGTIGGKLCGAGAAGCFVFYTHHPEKLKSKLTQRFPDGIVIPFEFEYRNIKEINFPGSL